MTRCEGCNWGTPRWCYKGCKSFAKGGKGCRGFEKKVIMVHQCNVRELLDIQALWTARNEEYVRKHGNIGTCVLGAGFTFTYKDTPYEMIPRAGYQGSITWEASVPEMTERLKGLGCENVVFHWGNMD
jgi:hypothetical protein